VKLTLGKDEEGWPHKDALGIAEKLGANVIKKAMHQVCSDRVKGIFTTPAFMHEGKDFHKVFTGIHDTVIAMKHWVKKPRQPKKQSDDEHY